MLKDMLAPSTDTESPAHSLAVRLSRLGPRQQEIAALVYSSASVTPRDVQQRLSEPRSVRAVRTLLDRMVTKGLVKRRHSGRHREIVYVAAIPTPRVRQAAVQKLVEEQFGGSLEEAAAAAGQLACPEDGVLKRTPQTSAAVRRIVRGCTALKGV